MVAFVGGDRCVGMLKTHNSVCTCRPALFSQEVAFVRGMRLRWKRALTLCFRYFVLYTPWYLYTGRLLYIDSAKIFYRFIIYICYMMHAYNSSSTAVVQSVSRRDVSTMIV